MGTEPTATPARTRTKPTEKTRNNFSGKVAALTAYVSLKIELIEETPSEVRSELTQGRLIELKAILAKLEPAK